MFEYLIDKISKAKMHTEPYEYLFIENFLSNEHYQSLRDDYHSQDWIDEIAYNKIDYFAGLSSKGARDHCYNRGCGWDDYMKFIESDMFIENMCNKFGCENIKEHLKYTVHEYLLDFPEHYIPIHQDSNGSKYPVFQISVFLPDKDYEEFGTILYKDEAGNGAVELPMLCNSALIYGLHPRTAWHGTKPGKRVRKSLLTRYRTSQFKKNPQYN